MLEVVLREAHPELRAADGGDVLHEGLEFFVVHAVNFVCADFLRAGKWLVQGHRRRFDKFAVFPVSARGCDLADVDFGIEIGGKGVAVIAAVDVDDVEGVDFIEVMLERPCGINVRDTGIEAGAEQRTETRGGEFFLVGPLPGILELCDIGRLVVCGVEVIDARSEAGIHERQILVRQSDVEDEVGLERAQVFGGGGDVIGVDGSGLDCHTEALFDRCGDGIAFGYGAGGESDLRENGRDLSALVGDDAADSAGTDDKNV